MACGLLLSFVTVVSESQRDSKGTGYEERKYEDSQSARAKRPASVGDELESP